MWLASTESGSRILMASRPRSSRPMRLRMAAWLPRRPAMTEKLAGAPPRRGPSGRMSHRSSPMPRMRRGAVMYLDTVFVWGDGVNGRKHVETAVETEMSPSIDRAIPREYNEYIEYRLRCA